MINPHRILQLRLDAVLRRLNPHINLCNSIIHGSDKRVHGLGAMLDWMDRHHSGGTAGFHIWQAEVIALAKERREQLVERKGRAIAAAEEMAQKLALAEAARGQDETAKLTDDDLDRLEGSLRESSKGPWEYEEHWRFNNVTGDHEPTVLGPRLAHTRLHHHEPLADDGMPYYKANLRFVVEAKNAMEELIRELRQHRRSK